MIQLKDSAETIINTDLVRMAKKAYSRHSGEISQYRIWVYFDRINSYDSLEYPGTEEGRKLRNEDMGKILYK